MVITENHLERRAAGGTSLDAYEAQQIRMEKLSTANDGGRTAVDLGNPEIQSGPH